MASAETEPEVRTPAPEQDPAAVDQPANTPSRSPTSTNASERDSPAGDSQPSAAGMQELVAASSALLSATRDVSTTHNQASLRLPTGNCEGSLHPALMFLESARTRLACHDNRNLAIRFLSPRFSVR